jgi:L-2-hydroxyglutarate oxidase LhgO
MERVDCVVVGAGAIGLAVARRLALAGREVLILEKAEAIGTETSSRNSEVIHAGIYYPTGSLKARLCVAGRRFLYAYGAAQGVPLRNCGKLIVATSPAEDAKLLQIQAQAARNGVELELLTATEARAREPELFCTSALWSPSTGIIDSHTLMLAFLAEAEAHGALLACHTPVERLVPHDDGIEVVTGGDMPTRLRARCVVNAAGLHAPALAAATDGLDSAHRPKGYLCKGNYYTLSGRPPFSTLIYPVPEQAGLGIHVTLDLAGRVRFGPDTEWVEAIDYDVDPARAAGFYAAIRRYWPGLPDGSIEAGYAGIRPKLAPAGAPAADFVIQGPASHGISGLVQLFGIESPGLTACAPLADEVARALGINA